MMSPAHIAVGVAAAAVAVAPQTPAACALAVLGGSVGGLICDIDIRTGKLRRHDTLVARIVVVLIAAAALYADWVLGAGVWAYVASHAAPSQLAGVGVFVVTCIAGVASEHRSFAHSLMAVALWTAGVFLMCPPLATPFVAGALSHVVLDLLNKKPVRLLFPLKAGICLGWFRAGGMADALLTATGVIVALVVLLAPVVSAVAAVLAPGGILGGL